MLKTYSNKTVSLMNKSFWCIVFLGSFTFFFHEGPSGITRAEESSEPIYFFSINHEGLAVEVWFNDVRIDSDPDGYFQNRRFANNLFVINGENRLRITIDLPKEQNKPENLNLTAGFHVVLEDVLELPEPIAELNFSGEDGSSFPAEIETSFEILSPFEEWLWETAREININDPKIVEGSVSVLSSLHDAMSSRDITKVMDLLSVRTREMSHAYYSCEEEAIVDQRTLFQDLFNDPQFNLEPLEPENLRFIPMANNRMIYIEQKDGSSALETKELSEGFIFSLPIYLCKIGEEFIVVR
ncbi:hypothetical protein QA601_06005 [Chitinispirillales bacterium ANBcel5]|uniref:hypothetical protein n=1 Tax=Cellulosispirillum alkaliphilum TaxID=3039283 RepID=UPI002A58BE1D|nr:hypothetical protein [Chitinispirillales bacterium ANBcel5]